MPEIGETLRLRMVGGTANLSFGTLLFLGRSAANWGPVPLPFDLTPMNMPGCLLHTDPWLMFPWPTDGTAVAETSIGLPHDASLLGGRFYSQFMPVKAVNSAMFAATGGFEHRIGGWRID
jgi:hypothetical protein